MKVPALKKKRQYADYKLSGAEWEYLELVHRVLQVCTTPCKAWRANILCQEPATATQSFSTVAYPSLSQSIPVLEFLAQHWEEFAADPLFNDFSAVLQSGLDNLTKWYHSSDESDAYFIVETVDYRGRGLPVLTRCQR
jgi:hypothetical protein